MSTTQGYYPITAKRTRTAVDALAAFQFDRSSNRVWREARALPDSEHQRLAAGQVAVPFRRLLRAVQRPGRRRSLPVPVPLPGLRALPFRPFLPA